MVHISARAVAVVVVGAALILLGLVVLLALSLAGVV